MSSPERMRALYEVNPELHKRLSSIGGKRAAEKRREEKLKQEDERRSRELAKMIADFGGSLSVFAAYYLEYLNDARRHERSTRGGTED